MSSSWDSAEKSLLVDDAFGGELLLPALLTAAFASGFAPVAEPGARGNGDGELRPGVNKDRSFLHDRQRRTPIAFHVSQCPQTMPISVRKVVLDVPFARPLCTRTRVARERNDEDRGAFARNAALYRLSRNGQAPGMLARRPLSGRLAALGLVLLLAFGSGCKKKLENTPESVADAFVDAYFKNADQQSAKEFTALGATKMLEAELREVQEVRRDGYSPGAVEMSVRRGDPAPRDERVRIPYEIEIQMEGQKQVRDADIELSRIDGAWKVVRIGVKARDVAPAP